MLCRYFDDANGRFGGAAWLQARHCHTTFGEQLLVPVIVRRSLPYRTTLFGAFTSPASAGTWYIRLFSCAQFYAETQENVRRHESQEAPVFVAQSAFRAVS
jgi:hypothetical protein